MICRAPGLDFVGDGAVHGIFAENEEAGGGIGLEEAIEVVEDLLIQTEIPPGRRQWGRVGAREAWRASSLKGTLQVITAVIRRTAWEKVRGFLGSRVVQESDRGHADKADAVNAKGVEKPGRGIVGKCVAGIEPGKAEIIKFAAKIFDTDPEERDQESRAEMRLKRARQERAMSRNSPTQKERMNQSGDGCGAEDFPEETAIAGA